MKPELTSFGDRLSSRNCLPAQLQAQDLGLVLAQVEGGLDVLDVRHDGAFILSGIVSFSLFSWLTWVFLLWLTDVRVYIHLAPDAVGLSGF